MRAALLAMAALAGLGGLGGLGGCKDPRLDQMIEVRDEVCKCQDAACVDAALGKLPAKAPREERRAQDVAQQIVRCVGQVAEIDPAVVEDDDDAGQDAGAAPVEAPAAPNGAANGATNAPAPQMSPAPKNPPR